MRNANRFATASLLLSVAACSFAHRKQSKDEGCPPGARDFVIESDDYGSFLDPKVPACALEAIERAARRTNTIVVVGVHGWHHNADPDDEFVLGFAKTLREVRQRLDDAAAGESGNYSRSRAILTGSAAVEIFGVYVGWRGIALPGPLNYTTFWDRKLAAERVGEGDVREFLLRLNGLYRASYRNRGPSSPYFGMASVGHSFGAQILFRAIASTLEGELIEAVRASREARPGAQRQPVAKPLEGFGDVVVLINPALEAFQYERMRRLAAELTWDRRQPPVLLVLSAEDDVARSFFFRAGRWWDSLFRASMTDGQSDLWTHALGEYEPQRTHTITLLPEAPVPAASLYVSAAMRHPCEIVNFDLTRIPTVGRVRLEPIAGRSQAHSPFLVAYGGAELIVGHSGVFGEQLRLFINDFVGITRGKRLLLASAASADCPLEQPLPVAE
jgi:hypothetical protein